MVKTEGNQAIAASKAGMDAKTARKYRRLMRVPSELPPVARWRTRPDPFVDVWAEVEELLQGAASLEAKTVFEYLQRQYPGRFTKNLRTTIKMENCD